MVSTGLILSIVFIPLAYALGMFPSAALVAKRAGVNIATEGSGNPGASNVIRLVGWKAGMLVLALDVGKGALAAGVGVMLDGHRGTYILGVAAVLGHVFPVTTRFRGGKGVATAAGVLLVVFPFVVAILGVVWVVISRGLHKASIASVVAAILFPIIVILRGGGALDISVTIVLAVVVVARHYSNIRRLVKGEELGLGGASVRKPNPGGE